MQQDERVPQGVGDASESDAVTAQPERSVHLPCTPTIGEPAIYKVTQIQTLLLCVHGDARTAPHCEFF